MNDAKERRLIVISNRLPISILTGDSGAVTVEQGGGGLVTALAPVLRDRGGIWIGWPGSFEKSGITSILRKFSRKAGYVLHPVFLDENDIKGFYRGFANEILWPLFHEFQLSSDYKTSYWESYRVANAKFADAAAEVTGQDDFIWVHDYHLMLLAALLKEKGHAQRTGFFLHIPFPPADIFLKLPWRKQIVDALLEFDLIGFQTIRDRRNFYEAVERLYPGTRKRGRGSVYTITAGGKKARLGTFPISIDFAAFELLASRPETEEKSREIRSAFGDRFMIFGADRLDYTKGIPYRLNALRQALTSYPELHERICFVQVLVPSRQDVPQYQAMKVEIERMVGELNGKFASPGWTPVHYTYRNLNREELVCYYRAADMALITPLRDGMNLVAKEYVACKTNARGILCLSEFAGAAMEFHAHATMINPFDIMGMAEALYRAVVDAQPAAHRRKMRRMRYIVRRHDIFHWVDDFLMAAFSKRLDDFPPWMEERWLEWDAVQGPPWDTVDQEVE